MDRRNQLPGKLPISAPTEPRENAGYRVLLFAVAACVFVLSLTLSNLIPGSFVSGVKAICFLCSLAVAAGCIVFSSAMPRRYQAGLAFALFLALVLRLAGAMRDVAPVSDFFKTYDLAGRLAQARPSQYGTLFSSSEYLSEWPAYTPFVLFESLVVRLFGTGIPAIKLISAVLSTMTVYFAAAIARKLAGDVAGLAAAALLAVNPVILFFLPVLSSQHIAEAFFMLSIYLMLCRPLKRLWLNGLLAGLSLAVSQLFRPEMVVTVLAFAGYLAIEVAGIARQRAKGERWKTLASSVAACLVLLLAYFCVLNAADAALRLTGISNQSIQDTNVKYKLAVGLDQLSMGEYDVHISEIQRRNNSLDDVLKDELSNPVKVVVLMLQKEQFLWGDYNYTWSAPEKNTTSHLISGPLSNGFMCIIVLLVIFSAFINIEKKDLSMSLLYLICLGYFAVYALIEVQNKYNYLLIPIFTIFAASAAPDVFRRFKKKVSKEGK